MKAVLYIVILEYSLYSKLSCCIQLHDLVLAGWPPCCATSSFVVVVGRTRLPSMPLAVFYNEKRVAWVSISMHAGDPVPINMGFRYYMALSRKDWVLSNS